MLDSDLDLVDEGVAVIGMSVRCPGARNVRTLWRNLCSGKESITHFTDDELLAAGVDADLIEHPSYVKASGALDDIGGFAADFFGISGSEAAIMDPQHRIFLECAVEAMEDAGYWPRQCQGPTGVYAGAGLNTYLLDNLLPNKALLEQVGILHAMIGNKADFLPSKVAYLLGLRGEAINVSSACSTSLVAVHLACRSLLAYDSDLALAGGVTIQAQQQRGYMHQPGGVYSAVGTCRAFDRDADGTVGGSGAGIVVLKRLKEAVRDGDNIYAVIRGSAVNNDGADKMGFTAPGVTGQRDVIASALALADVSPESIGYVEAHGTGTRLGDPVEVRALSQAFRMGTDKTGYCAIGSIKPNLGHLDAASGVVSLIKAALCLRERTLVPSINYEAANAEIDFPGTPFYVNTELKPWPKSPNGQARRAGVSSFGIGGTNAHVILEEPPAQREKQTRRNWEILPFSAKSAHALHQLVANFERDAVDSQQASLADIAFTLQVGREPYLHRQAFLVEQGADKNASGPLLDPGIAVKGQLPSSSPRLVFMFPGIGDQYPKMAWNLYHREPVFREHFDRCADIVKEVLPIDLRELLAWDERAREDNQQPSQGQFDLRALMDRGLSTAQAPASGPLFETRYAHPFIFSLEYALARLWIDWVGMPSALVGYSLGEYAAAAVAGVMSLEDALRVVQKRADLIEQTTSGAMLAVALPEGQLHPLLGSDLSLAAINSPNASVVAGADETIAALAQKLQERGVAHVPVLSQHAFHSHMLAPIEESLRDLLNSVDLAVPEISFVSNLTGKWITHEQARDPDYWVRHTLGTVRFAESIQTLIASEDAFMLELGPGATLLSYVQQHLNEDSKVMVWTHAVLPAATDPSDEELMSARALAQLWTLGRDVNWQNYHAEEKRRRVSLPTYPFEREHYWVDPPIEDQGSASKTIEPFYRSVWKECVEPQVQQGAGSDKQCTWLLFQTSDRSGETVAEWLVDKGDRVITVCRGQRFARVASDVFEVRPASAADYQCLVGALEEDGPWPDRIAHLWGIESELGAEPGATLEICFGSVRALSDAFGSAAKVPLPMGVVSTSIHSVSGDEALFVERAPQLGACRMGASEYPLLDICHFDLGQLRRASMPWRSVCAFVNEFENGFEFGELALRGGKRWVRSLEPYPVPSPSARPAANGSGRSYLIYGYRALLLSVELDALLGLASGEHLILATDESIPPRVRWDEYSQTPDVHPEVFATIGMVSALEERGLRVDVIETKSRGVDEVAASHLAASGGIGGCIYLPGTLWNKPFDGDAGSVSSALCQTMDEVVKLDEVITRGCLGFLAIFVPPAPFGNGALLQSHYAISAFLGSFADNRMATSDKPTLLVTFESEEAASGVGMDFGDLERFGATSLLRSAEAGCSARIVVRPSGDRNLATSALIAPGKGAPERASAVSVENGNKPNRPDYVAPESEFEQTVADHWQQLFRVEAIGRDDNFFALGGNSLLAVQFFAHINELYHIHYPLKQFFQSPTVQEVATQIEAMLLEELEQMSDVDIEQQLDSDVADVRDDVSMPESSDYTLPNGLKVQQFNQVETDHFYKDIFVEKVYARNGISVPEGATTFDVGANIGLFSLFAGRSFANCHCFAFEPAPPVFHLLEQNLINNGVKAHLFNVGVGARAGTEVLTYYPRSTGMSSFHADLEEEKDVLRAIMHNQYEHGMDGMQEVMEYAEEILDQRFEPIEFSCGIVTLSEIIDRFDVAKIDLLKVDVQKSELEVLQGVDEKHWGMIKQVVVEAHDILDRVATISKLLEAKGFRTIVEQEQLYAESNISMIYALRP